MCFCAPSSPDWYVVYRTENNPPIMGPQKELIHHTKVSRVVVYQFWPIGGAGNEVISERFVWSHLVSLLPNILVTKTPLFDAQFPIIAGSQVDFAKSQFLFLHFFFHYMSIEEKTHDSNDCNDVINDMLLYWHY